MMDENKQPGIRFKNVILKNLSFSREAVVSNDKPLDISFNCQRKISSDTKKLVVILECTVKEPAASFNINCSIIGFFEADEASANMSLEQFAEENAPGFLFPYMREIISSTTLKAGINPVMLPPVNIRAMLKKNKE